MIKPQTIKIIKRVVLEFARHCVKPNRRSFPIRLGSTKSKVLINPTLAQTQNPGTPKHEYPSVAQQTLKTKAMKESYNLYNKLIIANDEKRKRAKDGS